MILFNTFLNYNLFNLIVVNFCKFRSYERSELQVHVIFNIFSNRHCRISYAHGVFQKYSHVFK